MLNHLIKTKSAQNIQPTSRTRQTIISNFTALLCWHIPRRPYNYCIENRQYSKNYFDFEFKSSPKKVRTHVFFSLHTYRTIWSAETDM